MAWPALFHRRRSTATPPPRPSRTLFFWLIGTLILALLPQAGELPLWISVVTVGALVVRALLEIYRLPLPSTGFTSLLALILLIGVVFQFGTIAGREAGTAFMAGLMAIKFYELRGPRDVSVIIFASFFIVMSSLLYSQALELFIYCLIMMWLLTAALLRNSMGDHPDQELLPMLRQAGFIFLQALPLALVLFFFFPRYPGKLQIPLRDAAIGITDHVAPGSVARLANNDSLAMYVRITKGSVPAPETMYWRGLVLWDYHDGVWTTGKKGADGVLPPASAPDSTKATQEITIMTHNQPWLFALDYPISFAGTLDGSANWTTSEVHRGGVLQLGQGQGRVDHTERYTVTSASQLAALPAIVPGEDIAGTELPDDNDPDPIDPQVKTLADHLFDAAHHDPETYIAAVLHFFHENNFQYTASPGTTPPGVDWLSYFLFTGKAGYCEHFASALAVLMRLENIPARLIVGYQGAEYNPYSNIYTVRQSNAHSWDEVWLESQKHWWRIDPTATLPPSLPNFAPANSSQSQQEKPLHVVHRSASFTESYLPAWVSRALTNLELRREEIEVSWDDWVFSYNPDTQNKLAHALGFGKRALGYVCAAAVLVCFLILRSTMRRRVVITPVENLYAKFCRSMAQRGLPRAPWEGPLAYTDRVAETFPEKKEAIQQVGTIIARSRYGPGPAEPATPQELQALLDQIAAAQAATPAEATASTPHE